jgi:hypothetical protein
MRATHVVFAEDSQRLVKDHLGKRIVDGVSRVFGGIETGETPRNPSGRQELGQLYDLFLVDDKVLSMMPGLLIRFRPIQENIFDHSIGLGYS